MDHNYPSEYSLDIQGETSQESTLAGVRAVVAQLEDDLKARGTKLSGRIIHVTHYLPIITSLRAPATATDSADAPGAPASPPKTPVKDIVSLEAEKAHKTVNPPEETILSPTVNDSNPTLSINSNSKWQLAPRRGHTAMISGIRSLCATHEQVILAWTGDIETTPTPGSSQRRAVPTSTLTDEDKKEITTEITNYQSVLDGGEGKQKINYVPVFLDDKIAHGHYEGYCKTTLWPLFHYLLWQDVAKEVTPESEHWTAYLRANEAYAEKLAEIYQPGDLIWVHDYHLLLLPRIFKSYSKTTADAYVGLFVHTPFPSSEVFRCLPRRREILDGMLGANLVVFQKFSYGRHFGSSCVRVCGYESVHGGIDVAGQITRILHCSVGVDADRIHQDVLRPGVAPKLATLRSLYEGKKIIIARDKLDVVKGIVQKLKAFERLLKDYPQWRGNVVMIQVTSPSLTDEPKLERQVSELVAHINGDYGSLDFIPVHHYHQTIKKDDFYALLSVADLALITPLRDGMNTTSMEYVICQQNTNKAPLILSEFMGISHTMSDALQINPWDLGVKRASRQAALYKVVTTHTSHTWAAILVRMLLSQIGTENTAHQTPYMDQSALETAYKTAKRRLLLFDYDGTLTPIVKVPSMAVPSEATLQALQKLSEDPRNLVYIISGRDSGFLEHHLGHLKNVGFSAEHGSFIREPGTTKWTNLTETLDMTWMQEVEELFEYYTERTTGSFVEMKKSSITWHYRAADPEWGSFQCKQCLDLLENNLVAKRPIEVLVGKKNLEVRPIAVNKGEIVKRILYRNPNAEFVFCAGDDKTDEDMFRALCTLFPVGTTQGVMQPPESAKLIDGEEATKDAVTLSLTQQGLFSTTVGHPSKKTLAAWHVTSADEVVDAMLKLVGLPIPKRIPVLGVDTPIRTPGIEHPNPHL
ncbi:related to trehalose-6-phosphate phosphatase [Serendipita indica DSM 11827]|uniref:Related to trehalose-6-phosphate phosphatase n=1 Tax=Serendipita indica (strain DSM 11827) TaxID=1109443 RepID=G4TUU4_SERID|nr:related to trehalose-6-phosphate phosphatase [Serendipita indica DSM 11827]